jgi:ABC-type Fe3+-hydroxamate transport system substrate-binding protein
MTSNKLRHTLVIITAVIFLTACGGSGGDTLAQAEVTEEAATITSTSTAEPTVTEAAPKYRYE